MWLMPNALPVLVRNFSPMNRQVIQMAMHRNPKKLMELLLLENSQMTGEKPMSSRLVMAMVQLWMPRMVENLLSSPPMQQKM